MENVESIFMKVINPLAWFIVKLPKVGWKAITFLPSLRFNENFPLLLFSFIFILFSWKVRLSSSWQSFKIMFLFFFLLFSSNIFH